jgi:arginyl-tRNA synthetase
VFRLRGWYNRAEMTFQELTSEIAEVIGQTLGMKDPEQFEVGYVADAKFGDLTTNAAMVHAKVLKRPPRELAEELAGALREKLTWLGDVQVAGPGFINMTLADEAIGELALAAPSAKSQRFAGQNVVTEYSDANPFKVLHAGHLYTSVVGDAISNLIRAAGGKVHAVNFGGDVGLHVGKTMWGILRELGGEKPEGLERIPERERSDWMAKCYVAGTQAYEDDEAAKREIIELNKRVYKLHTEDDHDSLLARIYWTCRQWSYDYFDAFYAQIGSKFERYYPESVTTPLGLKLVQENFKKGVFMRSQGAVVFEGERYGLHTRVFITSEGLPTYETKDVGLIMAKWRDYHFDRSVVITGNDITEYMKVVLKSLEQFGPETAEMVRRTTHITHGNVKLEGGVKMSSRKGNFLRAVDVLEAAAAAHREVNDNDDEGVSLGAVKYAFLKQRIGPDIVYVPKESVSLEGNSGPYLQYAHARARSILRKAGLSAEQQSEGHGLGALEIEERTLVRKISEYAVVMERAIEELMPHYICTYLYELAQVFNRFYERNRVIGHERENVRRGLVELYADVLRDGLTLLGIAAPEQL